jgi:hypothetical protein
MTVSENITYLDEQLKVFEFMLAEVASSRDARERQVAAERGRIEEDRAAIRALKRGLVEDDRLPSLAALEERLRLTDRIDRMRTAMRAISDGANAFTELSGDWARLREELAGLPMETQSDGDRAKVVGLQDSFTAQLGEYGVDSIDPHQIRISPDSFGPVCGDFDLQFDLSASDAIRSAWAYRTALLEVARQMPTHHPGLLMFDEPRQQDASGVSFAALLKRLSTAVAFNQQVIVATSEPEETLAPMLAGVASTTVSFGDRIIGRL